MLIILEELQLLAAPFSMLSHSTDSLLSTQSCLKHKHHSLRKNYTIYEVISQRSHCDYTQVCCYGGRVLLDMIPVRENVLGIMLATASF